MAASSPSRTPKEASITAGLFGTIPPAPPAGMKCFLKEDSNLINICSSDKQYGYLSYDFSLPPEQQLENLIGKRVRERKLQISLILTFPDGVTVPSHNKPVFIKSPKLPNGWIKKVNIFIS